MKKIIEFLSKDKIAYKLAREMWWIVSSPIVNALYLFKLFCAAMRKRNIALFSKYNDIRQFDNKHSNERCFIVCAGPSLTYADLEKLQGELCFSMNTVVKVFKKTSWRPTYYILNIDGRERLKEWIDKAHLPYVFTTDKKIRRQEWPIKPILFSSLPYRPYTILNPHTSTYQYKPKFSSNAFSFVYGGGTTAYKVIQIAVYMGFKEIYFVGCDCDYSGATAHFPDAEICTDEEILRANMLAKRMHALMTNAHCSAKAYADKHGINIYNATRGGKLEVYERVNLDDVLEKQ